MGEGAFRGATETMEFKTFVFYVFALILVFAAVKVISVRNPIQAALYLVLAFVNAAGIWMLLEAEFLAITLVLVYVGAVMVLFLFVVMMLDVNVDRMRQGYWRFFPAGVVVGGLLLFQMVLVLGGKYFGLDAMPAPTPAAAGFSNTREIGLRLYTEYAYPFELAAYVLLIAMIAAVTLTLRKRKGLKSINPTRQINVSAKDRVRLVSMPAEKDQ